MGVELYSTIRICTGPYEFSLRVYPFDTMAFTLANSASRHLRYALMGDAYLHLPLAAFVAG